MKIGTKMKRLAFLNDQQKEILGFSLAPGQSREIRVGEVGQSDAPIAVAPQLSLEDAPGEFVEPARFRAGRESGYGIIVAEYQGLRAELLVLVSDRDSRAAVLSDSVV